MSIQIGAFTLQRQIGSGGMGDVWLATHIDEGVDVALKVMTARQATDPYYREAFGREVRAVASLDHPAIVRVLDCGVISQQVADNSAGQIPPNSPYLVMELATGTLHDLSGQLRHWSQHRTILLRILDGLNHAHVRGVIHRDIKPENVLLVPGPDGPSLKLADFGLAHAYRQPEEEDGESQRIAGTPRFMAPEQILGVHRDQGPWTDLYAVGCMTYWLLGGRPPYSGTNTKEILTGHLEHSLPPLDTSVDVPDGIGAWLGRLMAKLPQYRYRLCADAAFALASLDGGDQSPLQNTPTTSPDAQREDDTTDIADAATELLGTQGFVKTMALPEMQGALDGEKMSDFDDTEGDLPPMPKRWERPDSVERSLATDHLRGVGLGLFGLRQLPLVDRIEERDRLWSALRRVHRTHSPGAVTLTGTMGVGKTRLAEWLAERALEVGASLVVQTRHSPIEAHTRGLANLVARLLRCHDMTTPSIVARIRDRYSEMGNVDAQDLRDCAALAEMVAPICDPNYTPDESGVVFSSPRERYALTARFLKRMNDGRPLLVLLDDAQWGYDSLRFVNYLLTEVDTPPPVLAIITVRNEALDTRRLEREMLDQLVELPEVRGVDVAPLTEHDHRRLVHALLGLDSNLAEDVVERTRGNPLFAIQLVGDWVDRNILVPDHQGFRVRDDASVRLPADIQNLLEKRLDEIARRLATDDQPRSSIWASMELAAALGREVSHREWHTACRDAGYPLPSRLVEALSLARLVVADAHQFTFLHGAIRECLQYHGRDQKRWKNHHRQCAETLDALYPWGTPGVASRIGRHYIRAGCFDDALAPLLRGADEARVASDFSQAHDLMNRHREAIGHCDRDDADHRLALNAVRRARTLIKQNRIGEAAQVLDKLEDTKLPDAIDAERLFALSILARARGDMETGLQVVSRSIDAYAALTSVVSPNYDDLLGHVSAIGVQANFLYFTGRLNEALETARNYLRLSKEIDAPNETADAHMQIGNIYINSGDYDHHQAFDELEKARQIFDSVNNRYAVAQAENALGELHRNSGDHAQALVHYQTSLELLRRIGIRRLGTMRFNIALCLIERGDFAGAEEYFHKVYDAMVDAGSTGYLSLVHSGLAVCAGARRDWNQWTDHFDKTEEIVESTGFTHIDIAIVATAGLDVAQSANEPAHARRAAALAIDQYERLEQPDEARKISRRFHEMMDHEAT